jgi:hypothetical protein
VIPRPGKRSFLPGQAENGPKLARKDNFAILL